MYKEKRGGDTRSKSYTSEEEREPPAEYRQQQNFYRAEEFRKKADIVETPKIEKAEVEEPDTDAPLYDVTSLTAGVPIQQTYAPNYDFGGFPSYVKALIK